MDLSKSRLNGQEEPLVSRSALKLSHMPSRMGRLSFGMASKLRKAVFKDYRRPCLNPQEQPRVAQTRDCGEATAALIDAQVRALVDPASTRTQDVRGQRRETLKPGAAMRIKVEVLAEVDVAQLLGRKPRKSA